jgi:hypothetical protein
MVKDGQTEAAILGLEYAIEKMGDEPTMVVSKEFLLFVLELLRR